MFERIKPEDLVGKGVIGLPDTPKLTTDEMQKKFEETARDVIIPKFNAMAEALEAPEAAAQIGATDAVGAKSTVQQELGRLRAGIENAETNVKIANENAEDAVKAAGEAVSLAKTGIAGHNTNTNAHADLRMELKALADRINAALDSDDTTLDELSEIVAYIKSNKSLIEAITISKVNVTDVVNDLVTNVANRPLSAAQGVTLKELIDKVKETAKGLDITEFQELTDAQKAQARANIDALGTAQLPTAVNTALAQAKASGEFDGKSAYAYAREGGYTGTEADFAQKLAEEPLIGTTAEITPQQVMSAMCTGKPFSIIHTDENYGQMIFNSFAFSLAAGNGLVASIVFVMAGAKFCAQLTGNLSTNTWGFIAFQLAGPDDIPEAPTALKNPHALTINGVSYDGSKAVSLTVGGDDIPDYVKTEAERLATVVQSRQNENTVSAILSSDYHLPNSSHAYYAQILESITHAGQAMGILRNQLSIDFEAKLGDLIWDSGETQGEALANFQLVHSLVSEGNVLDRFEGNGNHDHLQSNSTPLTDSQVYANIGIYNKDCVRDSANRAGGYCYKDYEDFKLRVILLNTSEANDGSFAVSSAQLAWLDGALSVSVEEGWGTLILSHHPIDWGGSNTSVMKKIKAASGIIATLHGHVHTFTQDVITGTEIPRLAIPNVCFYRNNEYGQNGGAENSEGIEFGTTTTYNKSAGTANDTSFCVLTLDRAAGKLYLDRYGAGIDRVEDVPTWGKKGYTNLVPTAQAMDSTDPYNGTGYKNNYRLSSSSPFESAETGYVLTGYNPYSVVPEKLPGTIYVKGAAWNAVSGCRLYFFTAAKGSMCGPQINGNGTAENNLLSTFYTMETLGENYFRLIPKDTGTGKWTAQQKEASVVDAEFFRISLAGSGADLIITLDEPIE